MNVVGTLPAIAGGTPLRQEPLPLARPIFSDAAIDEVVATLRSGWIATGPRTASFEQRFADYVGCRFAVGVTSGTAALGLALELAGVGPGDEVITTPLTFVATAHAIVHRGARPVFADVDPHTLNLDPSRVAVRLTPRTRAIVAMHFAGRPCAVETLGEIASGQGVALLTDSAHAIESHAAGRKLAAWFPLNAYSFHPTKNLTTGEGGMLTTDDAAHARRARALRLHGIERDAWSRRGETREPGMDVTRAGHKCNMSDLQAALGTHQLAAIELHLARRERLTAIYDAGLAGLPGIQTPAPMQDGDRHARHLYTIVLDTERLRVGREGFCAALAAERIATGHHYPALHRMTFYRERFPHADDELPHACRIAERIVSLPLHPGMDDADATSVVEAVRRLVDYYR